MRAFTASILLGALFLAFTPLQARADDAAALLAKHEAFVGWQFGNGSVNSLRLERTFTDADGKVTQRASELRIGLAFRRDVQSTKDYEGDSSTGFTSRLFWTTTANGFTVPITGDNAKYYLAIDALFMEGTPELPATMHGAGTIDGKSVPIVRVTMNGAVPMDLYVDPDTGAYIQAVIDPGGQYETTMAIHSYADLSTGKKIIGSWSFGKDKGVYAYTKTALNPSIDPSELHPPAPSATWNFANSNPFPIRVTDSRLYIDATINGTPGRFILDTGASGIALTDEFANRANVKTVDHSKSYGVGGATKNLIRKAETVSVGGNTLSNVIISSINLDFRNWSSEKQNEEVPQGLIGFDVFAGAIVDLTLSNGTMRIQDPAAVTADPHGGYPLTPDLTSGVPVVPATVDDHFDIQALLDTGGGSAVILSSDVENQGANGIHLIVNSENTFLGGNASIGGVGGSEMVRCGPLAKIQVGPFSYTQVEACESHGWSLHRGLVGFDFLKHFDYVFDYPHGVMYLIPHKE